MSEYSYTANEMGDKPESLTMKEINERYVNRIIGSLENDKEFWERKVMGGMDGCFVDFYSPKYPTTNEGTLSFSDRNYVSAYIDGKFAWEIPFWMYHNPFSNQSRRLRRAMDVMRIFHIEKDAQKHSDKLTNSIK